MEWEIGLMQQAVGKMRGIFTLIESNEYMASAGDIAALREYADEIEKMACEVEQLIADLNKVN